MRKSCVIHNCILIAALTICLFFSGCVSQSSYLVNSQAEETAEAATVEPSTTPSSELDNSSDMELTLPTITGGEYELDVRGLAVLDADTHYSRYYLEFSSLRVYEYESSTFLDGFCTNTYPTTLTGEARICFYGEDGRLYAYGNIITAEGKLSLTGESTTPIFAEILTEIPITSMEYTVEIIVPFSPKIGE